MPDLEQRIAETLDHLGERPDPARILERVGRRKRHLRMRRRVQTVVLVLVVLAGVGGGTYALSRAFGLGGNRVPSGRVTPSPSHGSGNPGLCSAGSSQVMVASKEGAAGTISTLWKVTNTGSSPCRSSGYPGMEVRTTAGWLRIQVHRGGFPNIDLSPAPVLVRPGRSLYFVSYWNDVTTGAGPCLQFDRVAVRLPGTQAPAEVATSGCLSPSSVDVGPVAAAPPP